MPIDTTTPDTPKQPPLISVCIANYNGADYITQCIQSVLNQKPEFAIEIIVHDDASTDESVNVVKAAFPEVKILSSANNVGFCISNNRMVSQARGEYILLLNNDATLRDGTLAAFLEYSSCAGEPCILGLPQYTLHDGSLVDRGYEFDLFMNPIPVFTEGPREVSTVTGACMWIPRIVWEEIGGFPPWFESVAEDIYLCHAARLLGYPVIILKQPGFDHWVGKNLGGGKVVSGSLNSSMRRRALSERNKIWVMITCYPSLALLLILPVHIALLACEAAALFLGGVEWHKLHAIYISLPKRIATGLRQTLEVRRRLQQGRRSSFCEYFRFAHYIPWKLVMLMRHGMPRIR